MNHQIFGVVLVIQVIHSGTNTNTIRAWNYGVKVGGFLGIGLGGGGGRGNGQGQKIGVCCFFYCCPIDITTK